jgi:hypothetical protein
VIFTRYLIFFWDHELDFKNTYNISSSDPGPLLPLLLTRIRSGCGGCWDWAAKSSGAAEVGVRSSRVTKRRDHAHKIGFGALKVVQLPRAGGDQPAALCTAASRREDRR